MIKLPRLVELWLEVNQSTNDFAFLFAVDLQLRYQMRTSAVNSNSCTNSTNRKFLYSQFFCILICMFFSAANLSTQRTISDNSSSTVSSKYSTQSSHQPLPPPAQQQQPTHENIFGRIRKACLVKTKFSTSSVKHTAEAASAAIGGEQQQQQSTTRDSNQVFEFSTPTSLPY